MAARHRPPGAGARLLLVGVLYLLAAGCADDDPAPTATPTPATSTAASSAASTATPTVTGGPSPSSGGGRPDEPVIEPTNAGTSPTDGGPPPSRGTSGTRAPEPRLPPSRTPTRPGGVPTSDTALQAFLDACERGVREWRAAQVSYPGRLEMAAGETVPYVAVVDVRSSPEAPDTRIPGPEPTAEAGFVRCEVAARLTPIGGGVEVDDEDWVLRTFTPSGVIRWSWAVTAADGGQQALRLELQPAVIGEGGVLLVADASTEVSNFLTPVEVEEDRLAAVGDWWSAHWGTVTAVVAGLGAAVLGLLRWGEQLAQRWRRASAAWRGESVPAERAEERAEDPDGGG